MAKAAGRARGIGDTVVANLLIGGVILGGLLIVLRLVLTGRVATFSASRAELRSRTLKGGNATLMLAAAALAGLAVSIVWHSERWSTVSAHLAPLLVASIVVGLLALVAFRSAEAVLAVVGFGADLVGAELEHGPSGVTSLLVLTMLTLMALAIIRGFVRPGRNRR